MFDKILIFLKHRLLEVIGFLVLITSLGYFYSLWTYSAEQITFLTPNIEHKFNFQNYSFYISDFVLQAFGLSSFLIFANLLGWGINIVFKRKINFFSLKILNVSFYLCLGTLGWGLVANQNFWLPDNGNGGFLGAYLVKLLPEIINSYKIYIGYSSIVLSVVLVLINIGASFKDYFQIIKFIFKIISLPFSIIYKLIKKSKTDNTGAVDDPIEDLVPVINQSLKPKKIETQVSLPLNEVAKTIFNKGEFKLPPVNYLNNFEKNKPSDETNQIYKEQSKFIENILLDFGIMGKIKKVSPGPVVTLYEFEPAAGIKTSKIVSLSEDIARSTSSISTRIAPVPGKNTIGIEIPNQNIEGVSFREIVESKEFLNKDIKIPITLGKTIAGYPVVGDLVSMPHLLIAGTTGSGKSVCINTLILSILYKHTPDFCKLILIDPKMLELSAYQGIPHLLSPVITEPKKATSALKWTVKEMESRYRQMTEEGVRNISGYNDKAKKEGKKIMPYIVVVVDEMADLMILSTKEIESYIQRLAQMARAAGIHIVMATQRPSVDVITGTIKANFPTRISFQVTSKIDSRTILGEQGAEQLLGKGDMLFMSSASRMIRIHGPFVSDLEIEKVATFLRSQGSPTYIDDITKITQEEENEFLSGNENEKDELFDQAVALVKAEGKASTSFLQRKFQIGYNRAARIIDQMEDAKIISPANHTGKRDVYL